MSVAPIRSRKRRSVACASAPTAAGTGAASAPPGELPAGPWATPTVNAESPNELREYSRQWTRRYLRLRAELEAVLGQSALRIDHVGSTSVPGLVARPVVDIQVSVADLMVEEEYRPALEGLGYAMVDREPYRRLFTTAAGLVQLSVCNAGGAWEYDHLLFAAYLRAHPDRRVGYERLKFNLAAEYGTGSPTYLKLRGPFVHATVVRAEPWAAAAGWRV